MNLENSEDTLLMITSSGKPLSNTAFPKSVESVFQDLKMFKKKFKDDNLHYIETSRQCGYMIPKDYIVGWLLHKFKIATKDIYLFYSGYGEEKTGDWLLDTIGKPSGEHFKFLELVQLWKESNSHRQNKRLFIFLDSCYSGGWCKQLKKFTNRLGISVFASCDETQRMQYTENGGLFMQSILQTNIKQRNSFLSTLFNEEFGKNCNYTNHENACAKLTKEQVAMLNYSITNAATINQQTQLPFEPKGSNKTGRQKEQELKNQIIKAAKVKDWESLRFKDYLDLSEKGLSQLPECFGDSFPSLQRLYLQQNRIKRLPSNFNNLGCLWKLWITVERDSQYDLAQLIKLIPPKVNQLRVYLKKKVPSKQRLLFDQQCAQRGVEHFDWYDFDKDEFQKFEE